MRSFKFPQILIVIIRVMFLKLVVIYYIHDSVEQKDLFFIIYLF